MTRWIAFVGCALCSPAVFANAAPVPAPPARCTVERASPWIQTWLSAWELTSREILRLPDSEAPEFVLYDSTCTYTTSEIAGAGGMPGEGPALFGTKLAWRAVAHHDSITTPKGVRLPVALMSFADSDKRSGPYFVMAAPSYWESKGVGQMPGLTAVFLHEFAHTRQVPGLLRVIGPIDSTWAFPEDLDDDVVQNRFEKDSVYVAAYEKERDLIHRAAAAATDAETRTLAKEALAMMRARHGRWFVGENAVFATLDDLWLSLEGAGQWAGYAWLAHPKGGGMDKPAAYEKMSGRRRRWSQDEGLELFLVVDRLLPTWPTLVFGSDSIGATALLERAVATP